MKTEQYNTTVKTLKRIKKNGPAKIRVDFGPRCPKCNKKVPPAQQASLRFKRTGICAHCANEYQASPRAASLNLMLIPGEHPATLKPCIIDGIRHMELITPNTYATRQLTVTEWK